MTTFEIINQSYKENILTKDDIYNLLLNNKIIYDEYKQIIGEEVEIPLDILKQIKIAELWKNCNETILSGFYSSVSGEEKLYGLDEQDQANISQTLNMIALNMSGETIYWKCKGEDGVVLPYTIEQFKSLCLDAQTHKLGNIQKQWTLKAQVLNATAKEELELLVW